MYTNIEMQPHVKHNYSKSFTPEPFVSSHPAPHHHVFASLPWSPGECLFIPAGVPHDDARHPPGCRQGGRRASSTGFFFPVRTQSNHFRWFIFFKCYRKVFVNMVRSIQLIRDSLRHGLIIRKCCRQLPQLLKFTVSFSKNCLMKF